MHWLVVLMTVASACGAWHRWSTQREVSRPPGVIVACEIVYVESLSVD